MDKYKDLPEIIADMLIKQDQTIDAVNKLTGRIDGIGEKIEITNNILLNFTEISTRQWEAQARFNERLYDKLDQLEKTSEKTVEKLTIIDGRLQHLENR
jgi:chromosome segregation ATPase